MTSLIEQLKFLAKILLPYVVPLWIYIRFLPQLPILLDLMIFPGSMLLYALILRRRGLDKRYQKPTDNRFHLRGTHVVVSAMHYSVLAILLPMWMAQRHEGSVPEAVLIATMLVGFVGLFVSLPAHSVMEFVARRRKRKANATESIPEL